MHGRPAYARGISWREGYCDKRGGIDAKHEMAMRKEMRRVDDGLELASPRGGGSIAGIFVLAQRNQTNFWRGNLC